MKKIFKALTIAVIALVAVFACAFAAACKPDDDGYAKSDYNFTIVYEDDTPVNGQTDGNQDGKVLTQFCLLDEAGSCVPLNLANIYPDAKGRLSFSQTQVNELLQEVAKTTEDVTQFAFHVMYVPGHKGDCEVIVNGKGDYKVTVTAE